MGSNVWWFLMVIYQHVFTSVYHEHRKCPIIAVRPEMVLVQQKRWKMCLPISFYAQTSNQNRTRSLPYQDMHDDVIKWRHFARYWLFERGIHRSPVNSPLKGQWRGALMFSLICVWTNGWENNREAGDLRQYRAHYDVIVMCKPNHRRD